MWTATVESLPSPSILEKLKGFNPDAPEWVMSRSEELQRIELAKPLIRSKPAWAAFVQGVKDLFSLTARDIRDSVLTHHQPWDVVGDYLRMAIRDYMEQSGLTPEMLDLTDEEKHSLNLIYYKNENYPALEI
ncbi:MAG: hypothetical protein LRY76_03945 [Alphaproteobacteria bacterium]|nr:hypothetical protein [Alphaproteobacteria bacterium]